MQDAQESKESQDLHLMATASLDEQAANLYKIRHSLAHILAAVIQEMRPGAKLGFGPPIADGVYYDFILPTPLTAEDFPEIEKRMKHMIKQNHAFVREELSESDALARIDEMGEPYKRQYAQELFVKKNLKSLGFYRSGKFVDMCDGPHVETSRKIPTDCFKIRSLAGAYWRGDSKNVMMTRVYLWAFESKEKLDAHVKAFQEALERDHKKLGKELEFFAIDDEIGKGLPLWMPNGTVIREEFEKLMKELEFADEYHRVSTPNLAKTDFYYRTGHLPYYKDSMYPFMELKEERETADGKTEVVKESYVLRPMNCPHHHKIFANRLRSYRELPLRLAEYGNVYRFEDSGALSGLLRVRGMCQNDAHIYCTPEQAKAEVLKVIKMHESVYKTLDITNYYMRLSLYDPTDPKGKDKFIDDPAGWEATQKILRETLEENGYKYVEGKGEAAFYGPKIDFQIKTVTGREESASTVQLDFGVAPRLGLVYTGADNKEHHPYIVHRAPMGTHERFAAFMIEHFGGAFPTWLAPVQVRMVPVGERFNEYAHQVRTMLRKHMIRAEVDESADTMGKKIRNGTKEKIPNLLIVGEKEMTDKTVTLRRYGIQEQPTLSLEAFEEWILKQIKTRALK